MCAPGYEAAVPIIVHMAVIPVEVAICAHRSLLDYLAKLEW